MCARSGSRAHPAYRARERVLRAGTKVHAGDYYIGTLEPSVFGNPFKVAVRGRIGAIRRCEGMLRKNDDLLKRLPQLSGFRLVCHCRANQACHADSIITVYKSLFPAAFNGEEISTATAPSAEVLSRLANLREVPDSDDGSTADEGAPARRAGWVRNRQANADWIGVHGHMRRPDTGISRPLGCGTLKLSRRNVAMCLKPVHRFLPSRALSSFAHFSRTR